MADRVRAAVVGVGYLGAFHAQKYASLDGVDLVAVVDSDLDRAQKVARDVGTVAFPTVSSLRGKVDCVSLAVPTTAHHAIGIELLAAGIDLLVEKPITPTAAEGRALVELAEQRGLILQVGHLERFNPAIRSLSGVISQPRFIECHRLAPFVQRGTEVDVILDLMIHDLDIILSVVDSDVVSTETVGVPVISEEVDIANARLRFACGTIANVTASRVALKKERKIRFFQSDTYVSVDYGERQIRICRRKASGAPGALPEIDIEETNFGDADPLFDEVEAFVGAVRSREKPLVDGATAVRVLELAERLRNGMETE